MKDEIGDRFKNNYENPYRYFLPNRLPVIIRLDGRSFHSYTRGCNRPFDENLMLALDNTAIKLCSEIQGAQLSFNQSDELSILINNYKTIDSQPWFHNNLSKIISISAAIASSTMTVESEKVFGKIKPAQFDSRAFVVPESEVVNYFIYRQIDWKRNSLSMLARAHFSHKELNNKNTSEMHEMLFNKGANWSALDTQFKNGRCCIKIQEDINGTLRNKWIIDKEIPIFTQDRNYIEKHLVVEKRIMQIEIEITQVNNKLLLMKFCRDYLGSSLEEAKKLVNKELPITIKMWWHDKKEINKVLNNIVESYIVITEEYSNDYIDVEEISKETNEAIAWYNSLSIKDRNKIDRLILTWGGGNNDCVIC